MTLETMKKITALGDSIIKGVIADENGRNTGNLYKVPENNLTDICSRGLGVEVFNLGKFGCTISAGEKIIERNMEKISQSEIALLEFGGNDSDHNWVEIAETPRQEHEPKTPLQTFISTYRQIITKLKNSGTTPVILSLPPIDCDRFFAYFTQNMDSIQKNNIIGWLGGNINLIALWHEMYNKEVVKIAYSCDIKLIDISPIFLKHRNYNSLLCFDGIHPNVKGQELIANQIIEDLRNNNL